MSAPQDVDAGNRVSVFYDRVEQRMYDVAFALCHRLPPLESLPHETRVWLRERSMMAAYELVSGNDLDFPTDAQRDAAVAAVLERIGYQ